MKGAVLRGFSKGGQPSPQAIMDRLGADPADPWSLPFVGDDVTAGSENELQAVVLGRAADVDLPVLIRESNYFKNIIKRQRRGDLSRKAVTGLEDWLSHNLGVWENSWVRLPLGSLRPLTAEVLERDLRAVRNDPSSPRRADVDRFLFDQNGREMLRIPVSYLLKLALTDAAGRWSLDHESQALGLKLGEHFLCDNTSPETYSFHVVHAPICQGPGRGTARETARRYLLTQLLTQYADHRFGLKESGQSVRVYFAPHPPIRQKELNDCISDSFYRELFMNPCLSGWERGEEKQRYMHLCHEVLSRAQLNGLARLKEAGIVNSNLVVLPSTSNISLANNGVHVSIGSRMLTGALAAGDQGFGPAQEKYLGDLAIKFVEHFLPLFVGVYSAAPYRLAFADFHPEKVLSFLPYQLDYTHLRMIWRRWKKKARLKAGPFGFRLTPFGPPVLDNLLSRALGLDGDFLPDYRLLDYLVAVMSTDQCPALDGRPGNQDRLKKDLAHLGVFDPAMPVYMLYRQREFARMGFSGFEGRYYSLFESLEGDMAPAVDLQTLITALAYKLMAQGRLTHAMIPDIPEIESERRQIFFGAAIGLPTFFVQAGTKNAILADLVRRTPGVRPSRRYAGYVRVRLRQFLPALAEYLRREAADLAEAMGLEPVLDDLESRLLPQEECSALSRLEKGVLGKMGLKDPFRASAAEFNRAAESYYRQDLRRSQMAEAFKFLEEDMKSLRPLLQIPSPGVLAALRKAVLEDQAGPEEVEGLIHLLIKIIALQEDPALKDESWEGRHQLAWI